MTENEADTTVLDDARGTDALHVRGRTVRGPIAEIRSALMPVQILVDESRDEDARKGLRQTLALLSELYRSVEAPTGGAVGMDLYGYGVKPGYATALMIVVSVLPFVDLVRQVPADLGTLALALYPGPQTTEQLLDLERAIESQRPLSVHVTWTVDPGLSTGTEQTLNMTDITDLGMA